MRLSSVRQSFWVWARMASKLKVGASAFILARAFSSLTGDRDTLTMSGEEDGVKVKVASRARPSIGLGVFGGVAWGLKATVDGGGVFVVVEGVALERLGEADGEVELAAGGPAAGFAHTGDGAVGAETDAGPEDFAGVVVDAAAEVEEDVALLAGWVGVAVDSGCGLWR